MDDGNDTFNIDNGAASKNEFKAQTFFNGGDDNDTLLKGAFNLFAVPEQVLNFETVV